MNISVITSHLLRINSLVNSSNSINTVTLNLNMHYFTQNTLITILLLILYTSFFLLLFFVTITITLLIDTSNITTLFNKHRDVISHQHLSWLFGHLEVHITTLLILVIVSKLIEILQ